MKLLISGICGFVGSTLAHGLLDADPTLEIVGFDNFIRPGSESMREPLRKRGVKLVHADIRAPSDMEMLPRVDWILDAAANPSVLAGVDGLTSSRQLIEHNLYGTVNILELAKRDRAGCILLSTSRVYAIEPLAELKVDEVDRAFRPATDTIAPAGLSTHGIAEGFSTAAPISLYGSTKLASECLALEYGRAFDFPVWINRCGVLAGAGQFGRADQGIFAFWINAYLRRRPLKYIGFGGRGFQVRDALHPRDLVPLLLRQFRELAPAKPRTLNFGGGVANAMSLAQLSDWCAARFGTHDVGVDATPRPYDLPWVVMDARAAESAWDWRPETSLPDLLEEIAAHAEQHEHWLDLSAPL
ncbi:MAG: NAD-dependent epimerase/dehydratase family protein [Verrucomicrobiota bacterium]|nr:NAD-dependent epimerase/dehydratase family protein [Verrucomicrobiota bacterium]